MVGSVESEALAGPGVLLGNFVTNRDAVTVPAATRVGEVEGLIEIFVEIGFVVNAKVVVVVVFPQVLAVELGGGGTVHTNAVDGVELTKIGKPVFEVLDSRSGVTLTEGHVFVVVAYLVAEGDDLSNHIGVVGTGYAAEVIDRLNAQFGFYLGEGETMVGTFVHIVTKGERDAALLQSEDELAVFFACKVHIRLQVAGYRLAN